MSPGSDYVLVNTTTRDLHLRAEACEQPGECRYSGCNADRPGSFAATISAYGERT